MNLLSRIALCAFAIGLLFALSSVPVSFSPCDTGRAQLGPTLAWAGGSPDETLHPPADPPKSKWSPTVYSWSTGSSTSDMGAYRRPAEIRTRWSDRVALVWRFYLTSVLRF